MNSANFLRDTIDVVRQIETRFLELGARLFRIQREELWEDSYDSYKDFLIAAKINPSIAAMLTAVHETYIVKGGVLPVKLAQAGYSNLYAAIPLIERDGVKETVERARLLSRSELLEEVREEKHGECKHLETITICSSCHQRV